nr:AMP-binding protein [Neoroseomonas soli]
MFHLRRDGRAERITFDALRANSARLAHVLSARGIRRGDRLGILLPQGPEALLAVLAALRLGAIAVPFARSLPPEGLAVRLRHAGCAGLVTDAAGMPALAAIRHRLPALRLVFCADGAAAGALSLWQEMERASTDFPALATDAGAPALLLYGATPRGVLHAHRALSGHVPGLREGQLLWAPGDWAGRGGLLDAVLPALGRGVPVLTLATEGIEPERALRILARGDIGAAVLPAAALRRMRDAVTSRPIQRLPALATFDGPLDADLRDAFGASVVEAHALPECGVIAATGPDDDMQPPGSVGRAVPGRRIAVLGPDGMPLPAGQSGAIALRRPDPGIFLGYWQDPAATAAAFRGPWLLTGESGTLDTEGRLSPLTQHAAPEDAEAAHAAVERCLRQHPAVATAALIGAAEAASLGEATAIVIPSPGARPGPDLAAELRDFLRARLAGDQCPRRVAFAAALPGDLAGPTPAQALGRAVGTGAYGAEG